MLSMLGFILAAVEPAPLTVTLEHPSFVRATADWSTPGALCRLLPRHRFGLAVERSEGLITLRPKGTATFAVHCEARVSAAQDVGPLAPGRYRIVWDGPSRLSASVARIVTTAKGRALSLKAGAPVVFQIEGTGKARPCTREYLRIDGDHTRARLKLLASDCSGPVQHTFNIGAGAWTIDVEGGRLGGAWALDPSEGAAGEP